MGKFTKEDILIKARLLFNEHGYNNVSMRTIADTLGISVGNLTYHYKKKNDLIEAVVKYKHRNYVKIAVPRTLEELNRLFLHVLNVRSENAYYFNHYFQLSLISNEVYNLQLESLNDLQEALEKGFQHMIKVDLMKQETRPDQSLSLIQCILSLIVYKPVNTANLSMNDAVDNTLHYLWNIIYMYLTDEGRLSFNKQSEAFLNYTKL